MAADSFGQFPELKNTTQPSGYYYRNDFVYLCKSAPLHSSNRVILPDDVPGVYIVILQAMSNTSALDQPVTPT